MKNFPNALVIVTAFILLAGILTYLVPKGQYDRKIDPGTNREIVVPGSYHEIDAPALPLFSILLCVPKGIIAGIEVIILIFMVGGCFYIVERTGALKEGVVYLTQKVNGKESIALVLVGLFFVMGGAFEGMQEEIIALTPILLVLTNKLGYRPVVTVAVSYGAAIIGCSFSPFNPFGVVVAKRVADMPFLTGSGFRLATLAAAFIIWMAMTIQYANKHRIEKHAGDDNEAGTISRKAVIMLSLVALAFSILIFGMLNWSWGLMEMSAEFFGFAVVLGLIGGLGINGTFMSFVDGIKEMTFASLIVGFSYSISLVLKEGMIIDTIIYALFTPVQHLPVSLSAIGMMVSQAMLHLVVPSTSGQAVLTIPILIPLSDLIGLSREICILAYQCGGMIMDLVVPTSGALMAILAVGGLSIKEWLGFAVRRVLVIFVFGVVVILVAGMIGF